MHIRVLSLEGRELSLLCEPTDTVNDVHEQILRSEGLPTSEQRLVFADKPLVGDKMLMDYNIQHETTLHLVPSLIQVGLRILHFFVEFVIDVLLA